MKVLLHTLLLASALAALPQVALADWDDYDDDHDYYEDYGRHREFKEEYWVGNCKIKREYKRDGEYKEKRKCKPPRHRHYYEEHVYYEDAPSIVIEPVIRIGGFAF
ncbi:hypothetical protein [Paracandidimonas lactea]|uniref:hypothetical protein n=1 Tax=Paracandidimonas lactea TaxID=2895524 RepID=UPI001F2AA7E5